MQFEKTLQCWLEMIQKDNISIVFSVPDLVMGLKCFICKPVQIDYADSLEMERLFGETEFNQIPLCKVKAGL